MKITNTGVKIIDEVENNNDVTYNQPYNLNIMNPIPDNNQQRRYVPLSGLLSKKSNIQEDVRYDGNGYVTVFYQMNTQNQSFLDMHYYLKAKGIKNNKFHLLLYDKDLANIDPHDPNIPVFIKQKVFLECQRNFW